MRERLRCYKMNSNKTFEEIKHLNDEGNDFWYARELQLILDYKSWQKFKIVIEKAKVACINSGNNVEDHFIQVDKKVVIGSNTTRIIQDIELSRYACYLIVQNGDSSKEVIASGQTYFAIKTREQELANNFEQLSEDEKRLQIRSDLKKHNKFLAKSAKNAGGTMPEELETPKERITKLKTKQVKKIK